MRRESDSTAPDISSRSEKSAQYTFRLALVTFAVLAGTNVLYIEPYAEGPTRTDVLFVLAPSADRIAYAENLMEDGVASTLAISAPTTGDGTPRPDLCESERRYVIVCFSPEPVTTRGEARALRTLSQEHGWKSANVMTAQFHVTRARILMHRCYDGNLSMTAFKQRMPLVSFPKLPGSWAYHVAYETAAFVKVGLNQDC